MALEDILEAEKDNLGVETATALKVGLQVRQAGRILKVVSNLKNKYRFKTLSKRCSYAKQCHNNLASSKNSACSREI
jgi:hypothetical protein